MAPHPVDDEHLRLIQANIDRYGLHLQGVVGTRPGTTWTYTVGLLPLIGGEVVTFGIDPARAGHALNALPAAFAGDEPVAIGRRNPLVLDRARYALLRVEPGRARRRTHWCPAAVAYWRAVGRSQRALRPYQLVWSDDAGRLPWERGFDRRLRRLQPLLDVSPPRARRRPAFTGRW